MKWTFTLKNIDTEKIHKLYDLNITPKITIGLTIPEQQVDNITKLSDLSISNEDKDNSFIDDKESNMSVTMLDYLSLETLPSQINLSCFWCRHPFNSVPIGCPLKYNASQLEKTYYSDITKDKYTIRENISVDKRKKFMNNNGDTEKAKYALIEREYYETDGVFCSFNCCLSFINENKHNSIYKHSKNLLKKIYYDFFGSYPDNLIPSPSWRLLREYGGNMSIDEYRGKLNKVEIVQTGMIRNNIKFKMCGLIFNDKNKF